jgi:phage repressor protein C with HTH and peptisase S24 domain
MAKDIPVLGTVAGADLSKGAFQLTPDTIDYVRRPPALETARTVYALYVEGDSMSPRFEPGELIYVNPNRPVRVGDYVVVQEPLDGDGNYSAWVKAFVKRTSEWLVVRQLNPPGEMRFRATEGLRVHRVMTTAEILGL